jgi:peptide/nickel transport system substrate-binding protein
VLTQLEKDYGMSRKTAVATAVASALLIAACGGGGTKSATPTTVGGTAAPGPSTTVVAKPTGTVTIANVFGSPWTCGFNPMSGATQSLSVGVIYEPLVFIDILKNGKETPMLATGYQWSADKKTLTFTMRDGVKWSDGQTVTGDDVAYTFNLMKKDPVADTQSIWATGLQSVTANGNQVVFVWNTPALPYLYYVADLTGIVPQHIWTNSDHAKISQALDDKPVGTGPFLMDSCTPQLITYTANPNYWQPNEPHIAKVLYPSYLDNGPANLDLALGKDQWGGQYIAGMQSAYADKDPANNHFWNPPTTNVAIFFNLKHPITGQLAVRQAFAYGIDRASVAKIGEGGLQNPGNQCGIVLPNFKDWYDAASCDGQYNFDQAKAKSLLAGLGYSPSHPLSLNILTITGYTDWDASLQEIKSELAPVGIKLNIVDQDNGTTFLPNLQKGNFDLAYQTMPSAGPSPWYELRQALYGPNSAPLGQQGSTNYIRMMDPAVDALFDQYASADDATQHSIVKQLEQVMLTQIPFVPTTESVDWNQYNTKNLTGWATPDDQYALPAPYAWPDWEQILLHLQFKS